MLGMSAGLMGCSGGEGAMAAAGETHENGGSSEAGGPSSIIIPTGSVIEESDRSGGGGNRWPRQETLALLKIRSDMDGVFKDANLKGPLWDEVSRKMAELGFQRNPKKCKEKFENVYKYHKRTKDGRASKPDTKSYRFFDQLEALEAAPPPNPFTATPSAASTPPPNLQIPTNITVSSTSSPTPLSIVPPIPPKTTNINNIPINSSSPFQQQQQSYHQMTNTSTFQAPARQPGSTSSSSTSSDEDIKRRGRKRKWKDYFERLMKEVVQKQEELQSKFLDGLERRERDRMAREEAWRVQEAARIDRERKFLVQERSMTAAKDKAVIEFLQKVANEKNLPIPIINNSIINATQQAPPPPPAQPVITPTKPILEIARIDQGSNNNMTNYGDGFVQARSSSRWPKAEVEALIKLRTSLDIKYQENGPKGPLWEEISGAMAKIGYNRNPKRCKEKWENINKYYKKVKESNRKRPEDSKTCPYFQLLEEIYKEKAIHNMSGPFNAGPPIMARPEQQWPISEQRQQQDSLMHDDDASDHQNNDELEDDEDDELEEEGVAG
ncbi:hypothetical protein CASFOL_016099 [Castilleja foliolosa]|uniref:Myb-like domain-containing protein n=1 Tax=Castilleja foliolosa TaxID=1961234 RepID=A0ABD3DHN0_9LAMI